MNAICDALSALIAQVERLRGIVIGCAGDAITGRFDDVDGDASLRAAHCAWALQAAMSRWPERALTVAVGTGPARRFAIGHPGNQQFDALAGAMPTRVATAEGLARSAEVLVDEATAQALGLPLAEPRVADSGARFVLLDTLPSAATTNGCCEHAAATATPARWAPGAWATT
jgi:class 3 adenylate cyclase